MTHKILMSAKVPLVFVVGLRVWGLGLTIADKYRVSDFLYLESSTCCIKLSISCLKVEVVEIPMWPSPSSSHVTRSMLLLPPSLAS